MIKYLPATLETARPRPGDPRTAKVRIYVDPMVQMQPHWHDEIVDQVDYANQLLQPMIGLRLVIESIKDWARTGAPIDAMRELGELDKAEGVAWVIGYVAPPEASSSAMSELGDAQPLGHYVIVRGWTEKNELEALAGRLPDVKSPERGEVLAAHRRHKQTVVLLHMLATTLGAIAEADSSWIQHLRYSPKQSTFANRTRDLLQLAVDSRLSGDADQALAKKLTDAIEKNEWGGWVPASHDEVLTALKRVNDAARSGKTFADVPQVAYEEMQRITELAKRGQLADALTELDNLLIAYPGNATMHELKCELMLGKPGVTDKATRAACARVAELAPGDPTVHFAVGEALIGAGDLAGARAELAQAQDKIANLNTGADVAWRKLIALYTSLGSLTWTEEVVAKAGPAAGAAAAATTQTRVRYGIPRGAKFVAPDQEAQLVTAVRGALDLIYANKFADAARALAKADKKWPNAPGLIAARCDLAFRQGQIDLARATCARALAVYPEESWALYLEGVILLRELSTTPAGIARLKKAIEIDPQLAAAWRTLGKAYARGRDKPAFDQLNTAYAAKFGQPLPQ